jgi:nitrile hydratase accessory protein
MPASDRGGAPSLYDLDGIAEPPRKNGELVFDAMWEGRVFGVTMALHEAGAFAWEEFRQRLIAEIAAWERSHARTDPSWNYWERWLAAFAALLAEKGICPEAAVASRMRELAEHAEHSH